MRRFTENTLLVATHNAGKLEEIADISGFAARRAESEANGKLRGLGVNCYIEACGIAPSALVGALGAIRKGILEPLVTSRTTKPVSLPAMSQIWD